MTAGTTTDFLSLAARYDADYNPALLQKETLVGTAQKVSHAGYARGVYLSGGDHILSIRPPWSSPKSRRNALRM